MKRRIWIHHLISAVFAFVLSVSAIGNLITGYELPVVISWKIYLWCGFFAFASSVLFRFRYCGRIILILAAFALWVIWKRETAWLQLQSISYIISSHYHDVYAWPVIGTSEAGDVSLPLILWGAMTAICVNWHFCRRKHIIFAILPVVLPLVLCLITNDRVPSAIYLYGMILGIALLLITDWTRRNQPAQGVQLVLRMTVPIAAALALLFTLNPRDAYVNHANTFQKEVMSWFEDLQTKTEAVVSGTPVVPTVNEKINLRTVGPKREISRSVMRVKSPVGGTLYLRGRDYDRYTGTGWESSSDRNEEFTSGGGSAGEITIVTYGVRDVLYVPYYAAGEIILLGGALENEENLQRYSYSLSLTKSGNSVVPDSRYTELPDDTLAWAREIVSGITDDALSTQANILRIQQFVRSSATYDLSTSRMDPDYSDFARWFLEESESGYCVHFATAATVLLRAAGVPARYVEGYMVSASTGSDVVVSNQDAHAWVEFYDSGAWHILEATPADPEEEDTEPVTTVPETEATPEETEAETEQPGTEPNESEDLSTKPHPDQEKPSGNKEGQDKEKKPFQVPDWLKTLFNYLLVVACIPLQGHIRIIRKRALWNRGRPNERTMTRWRQTYSLAKLLKQPYPEELDHLAQKAKFSQHRIQPEELQRFEEYRISLMEVICCKPVYLRIIFKWIFAIN